VWRGCRTLRKALLRRLRGENALKRGVEEWHYRGPSTPHLIRFANQILRSGRHAINGRIDRFYKGEVK